MIEGLSNWPSVRSRHTNAPLLKEREQYLQHLLVRGRDPVVIRSTAAYLIHVIRFMELNELRDVSIAEIADAGAAWASYSGADRRNQMAGVPGTFIRTAKQWLSFLGRLPVTPAPPFSEQMEQYKHDLLSVQGLSSATVRGYSTKASVFLRSLSPRHDTLETVRLTDVLEFLGKNRAGGHALSFLAAQCQALRSFFTFVEIKGWCVPNIPVGIRSPRLARYQGPPRGPAWADVRKLLQPGREPSSKVLRARAILLLLAIYGLRSSEVAQLQLSDFDWRNETFMVRRAKRGGIQYFPIQYEVGEAIIRYLQHGRPQCTCRNLFVNFRRPVTPLRPDSMWRVVSERMKEAGIESTHSGPHALRHACATRLLKQGSSLQDIAEFLGHRNIDAVGIYARYDTRLLRKVAVFSLAGVR